jgi:hypothetical protein
MIRSAFTALAFIIPVAAHAADKAVMLTDDEQSALVQILDAATKAQGISIATNTVYFLNKIKSAPTVVPHVDAPAPKPKAEEPPE